MFILRSKLLLVVTAVLSASGPLFAQSSSVTPVAAQTAAATATPRTNAAVTGKPWEFGVFAQGGVGTNDRSDFKFFSLGVHGGKVLTRPHGPGPLRGSFEYAGEIIPLWQSYTPAAHTRQITNTDGSTTTEQYSGGTYTGISITPILLRWNFAGTRRWSPFLQGGGGMIWTNHKYPPDVEVTEGKPGGTSVFNFTPQGGVGVRYFLRPNRSIDFHANAVHISSASLGDHNPGVNASIQFQVAYTWWK